MSTSDHLTDFLLRCADGEMDAFEELYRLSSPKLYALCLGLLKNEDSAQEVLQESFIKIWNKAYKYDQHKGSAMTWMASITRNQALDLLRSNRVQATNTNLEYDDLNFIDPKQGPEETAQIDYSTSALMDCLDQLMEQQKRCIMLSYYYGHTHDELSKLLKKPLGTIKAWIRRGTEKLRECLE